MNYYFTSLIVILGVIISVEYNPYYHEINNIFIPAFALTTFGFIYQLTHKKVFGYIAMVGFIIFVPIGLMGIYAIKNSMDNHAKLLFKRTLENDNNRDKQTHRNNQGR